MKKRKVVKEPVVHSLTEDELEKIGEQFREVVEEAQEVVFKKQDEMKTSMQEQLVALQQALEVAKITCRRPREQHAQNT